MIAADVVAIVLAGGASSRFGSDKLAVELDGRPLLHHALGSVSAVAGSIVIVVAPDAPAPPVPAALAGRVRIARDRHPRQGPLAGVAAGLAAVAAGPGVAAGGATSMADESPRIALVVGGDMPSLVPGVLRLLAERLAADPDLAAMSLAASPPAPLPMAVRPQLVSDAVDRCLDQGRRSLRALLDVVPSAVVPESVWRAADREGATLHDVDRPEDLAGR